MEELLEEMQFLCCNSPVLISVTKCAVFEVGKQTKASERQGREPEAKLQSISGLVWELY